MKKQICAKAAWISCLGLALWLGLSLQALADPFDAEFMAEVLPEDATQLDRLALQSVVLDLAMGRIDPAHVDAYYGPSELEIAARKSKWDTAEIFQRAEKINEQLAELKLATEDEMDAVRIRNLQERIRALTTRIHMHDGTQFSFDEESQLLFGAVAPRKDVTEFEKVLEQIDSLLPGEDELATRVNEFRKKFIIPPDKLGTVFAYAIKECRTINRKHIGLPESQSFRIEHVSDKPWSGYNWYKGNYYSVIQINTDLPVYIDRAVDLGCHEGYPGHHVYNVLLEQNMVRDKGWLEYTLYPLFSPQSLIAEGSANYGTNMAFSRADRIEFEKTVLFPRAGLKAGQADLYYELQDLLKQLDYAGNEAARAYLDGDMTAEQAKAYLVKYTLATPERAEQRLRFFDTYRSYVINYNLGRDMVKAWVQKGEPDERTQWRRFTQLLSSQMSTSDLLAELDQKEN